MSQRLVKIAKELNVGTSTIVEFLKSNGFEIDNKPTAHVTEEMHAKLLKEFSKSIEEKVKADKLILGGRSGHDDHSPAKPTPPKVVIAPKPVIEEQPKPEVKEKPIAPIEEEK